MGLRLNASVASGEDATSGYRVQFSGQHPTVTMLILMVVAEVFLFGWLRYYFRSAHGG